MNAETDKQLDLKSTLKYINLKITAVLNVLSVYRQTGKDFLIREWC